MHHAPLRLLLKNWMVLTTFANTTIIYFILRTETGFYFKKLMNIKMFIKISQKSILHSDKNHFYLLFSVLHQK